MAVFEWQYNEVKDSRHEVFNFCESFREGDYPKSVTFDGKSVAQLHVHIANTYVGWLSIIQHQEPAYFKEIANLEVAAIRQLFNQVDDLVFDFFEGVGDKWSEHVTVEIRKQTRTLTPAKVFTHIITHEFHHKGQILMLARSLGYTPPDTDIIRF